MVRPASKVTAKVIHPRSARPMGSLLSKEITARKIGTSRCDTSMALVSQMNPATSAAAAGDGSPWK